MNKKRLCGMGLAAAAALQALLPQIPAISAAAAVMQPCSLDEFSGAVRTVTQTDASRDFYDKIVYDADAGTLSADGGEAQTRCGDLQIRNGELMLRTDARTGWESFEDAAAEWGYKTETHGSRTTITNEFQTARLIVKAPGKIDTHGADSAAEGYNGLHILQYADSAAAYSAYQAYLADPEVEYVQPSHRITLDAKVLAESQAEVEATVADVESGIYNSWGVPMIGTEAFIAEYLDAEVLPEVTVAVIDTGINRAPKLFDGRILDGGINISDSGDDSVNDDLNHGTHVTGTICEMTPSNVKILPIKVFDEAGSASDEQIYLGLMYALEQKADIVNMSFGGLGVSPLEIEAMTIADENGIICCAASGNNGDDAGYYYPGSIDSCITVGAVNKDMERAAFSNYGNSVDVVAPGFGIVSYVLGNDERKEPQNGTSMATPHVSACCALLRSYDKTMTPKRAEALLRVNAKDFGPEGFDKDFAWGFVNMEHFRWDDGICPVPEFSEESGNYGQPLAVEITTELEDAQIYYTTDGTAPTPENGTLYEKPVPVEETTRILASVVRKGWISSTAGEAVYTINGKDVSNAYIAKDGVLLAYRGIRTKVYVPDQIDGKKVQAVAENAFAGNHFAEEIQLPSSVQTIGDGAFAECTELRRIYASGVTKIGKEAFEGCPVLQRTVFSDKIEAVGECAFRGCTGLTELTLEGLTSLSAQTFEDCESLKTVSLPDVTAIGVRAFRNCSQLTLPEINWQDVKAIGNYAFENCAAWEGDVRLPALETLGNGAFSECSLLRCVMLPEKITTLPESTFYHCAGLRQLDLPGITKIGRSALAAQTGRMVVPTGLDYAKITYVATGAFADFLIGDGYDTINFASLESLNYRSFAGAAAGTLAFPKLKTVTDSAFADAQIDCVLLEQAEKIEKNALTGVHAVYLTKNLQSAEANAFYQAAWIVAEAEIPAVKLAAEMRFCDEPLVMRHTPEKLELAQHESAALRVSACGNALKYQWYLADGETQTAIKGAVSPEYRPDTSKPGLQTYRCVITDAAGKTEQVTVAVTVTEQKEFPALERDQFCEPESDGAETWCVTVEKSGTYRIAASGAAAASGVLSDAAGQPVGTLQSRITGGETVEAKLEAGQQYYLHAEALWKNDYALYLTDTAQSGINLSECELKVTLQQTRIFDSGYQPDVIVCLPDGTKLRENEDYVLRFYPHNQEIRIMAYGIGGCCGCCETTITVYEKIPADTPIPVSIAYEKEEAVYLFTPAKSGKYRFYANSVEGYAEEQMQYDRLGRFQNGTKYTKIRTKCWIADTPEHDDTVFAYNDFSNITGSFFNSTVMLNAGQTYYFVCSGSAGAEYALVISEENYDLREAVVTGSFFASYTPGKLYSPSIQARIGETELTEGVDYQRYDSRSDIPGLAEVTLVGMGKYYGSISKKYEILYESQKPAGEMLALDTPVEVTCAEQRVTNLWFRADSGKTGNEMIRYRILNQRVSGSAMQYTLYRYNEKTRSCARMTPMNGEANDYLLTNGTYLIAVSRQYPEAAAKAKFSVLIPYSVTDAEVKITNQPYTGSEVPLPVQLIAPDGTELQPNRDYRIFYKDSNIMIGEVAFSLYPTERTYGYQEGRFEIYVDLPTEAPILEIGSHSVSVTKQDRLAVYRVKPETDMEYVLCTSDVSDIVLRVFSPEGEMLQQDYGNGTKSVKFDVPAGEERYLMVKFNGTAREGTINFRLETSLRLLSECEIIAEPHFWTGEQITPNVTFKDGDYVLKEGKDYRLRYTADDVNIGTATINYTGMGSYFGNYDVEFEIIPEHLFEEDFFKPIPLALDENYSVNKNEQQYVVYSYTSGIDTELNVGFIDTMCKLTVQCYDGEGKFLQSIFFKSTEEMTVPMKAGETVYFVISATDISSRNQTFNMTLHDTGSEFLKLVRDEEGGFGYRISQNGDYAEAYEVLKTKREGRTLLPEIEGIPVTFVPESLFADLPEETVIIGYDGCAAADYAAKYGFIYQQAAAPEQKPVQGDLNGDGKCSAADISVLIAILAEHNGLDPELVPFDAADLNGDEILDMQDLNVLRGMLES